MAALMNSSVFWYITQRFPLHCMHPVVCRNTKRVTTDKVQQALTAVRSYNDERELPTSENT
jgi:hypothetical protein